jgi:hypothetical protein
MRFMTLYKPGKESDAPPTQEEMVNMGNLIEEMARAGVLIATDGLQPSSKGVRVTISDGKFTVVDGPFAETKELIAGYWIWQVKSKQEAIEWVKRCPNPMPEDSEIEIRQIFEAEDFGPALTPELREAEERLRAQTGGKR